MTTANEIQIGGSHYQTGDIQHWDIIIGWEDGYAEGNATKYLSRWRKKHGVQDLEKARHYLVKAIEMAQGGLLTNLSCFADEIPEATADLEKFYATADIGAVEELIMSGILYWTEAADLEFALKLLDGLIDEAKTEQN